jgi:hypothetical protein
MKANQDAATARGEQIEALLVEIQAAVAPSAWPRVEALVTALVGLYGTGLERVLEHAREVATSSEGLEARLVGDELVSSLLLVHGLHPIALEQRIQLALARLSTELPDAARLELVEVTENIVKLRAAPDGDGRLHPPSMHVVARAIEHEAPEVAGLQIDGIAPAPPLDLLPVERLHRGGRP